VETEESVTGLAVAWGNIFFPEEGDLTYTLQGQTYRAPNNRANSTFIRSKSLPCYSLTRSSIGSCSRFE
jgi:hypothetical protein